MSACATSIQTPRSKTGSPSGSSRRESPHDSSPPLKRARDRGELDHRQQDCCPRACDRSRAADHRLQEDGVHASARKEHHMSITLIAITGILVGFLCLVIGFFMEDTKDVS